MKLGDLSDVESHLMGRIMTIERALNVLITAKPHQHEIAGAIRGDLQALSAQALYEPVSDDWLDGIRAAEKSILGDA